MDDDGDGGLRHWQEFQQFEEMFNGNPAPIKPVETNGESKWHSLQKTQAAATLNAFQAAHSSGVVIR